MPIKEKLYKVIVLNKSDFYSFKMWVKDIEFEDGNKARKFSYSIDRSFYKGKKEDGTNDYDNRSLGLQRASDISYIRKLLQILKPKQTESEFQIGKYYAKKIPTPTKKDPSKKALSTYEINREYFKKETEKYERTQAIVFPCNDIYVLMDFLGDCVKKVDYALSELEPSFRDAFYGDSDKQINNSQSNYKDDFIDEKFDDEIPF